MKIGDIEYISAPITNAMIAKEAARLLLERTRLYIAPPSKVHFETTLIENSVSYSEYDLRRPFEEFSKNYIAPMMIYLGDRICKPFPYGLAFHAPKSADHKLGKEEIIESVDGVILGVDCDHQKYLNFFYESIRLPELAFFARVGMGRSI